jgi:hypothetical protein
MGCWIWVIIIFNARYIDAYLKVGNKEMTKDGWVSLIKMEVNMQEDVMQLFFSRKRENDVNEVNLLLEGNEVKLKALRN